MKQPQNFSPYFIAKCYAAYYNSPAYLDGKTTGVLGVMLDDIIHFGPNGWKLKLWPIHKLQPDHARMILEQRSGKKLNGYTIAIDVVESVHTIVISAHPPTGAELVIDNLNYGPGATFAIAEVEFFRGFHYDIGFSYLHSLIEADLAVDASLLNEGPFWAAAKAPLTFRQEYINGLQLLARYAMAHQSVEHIGIINALIGAEMGGNTLELFHGMADIIKKLRKDSDNEHQRINN